MTEESKALTIWANLALIGIDEAEYWPSVLPTTEGAHQLTRAVIALAFHILEQEREAGSELPSVEIADPRTGEIGMNPAYEVMLRERALTYLQTMEMEGSASTFEILAEIEARGLYMWAEQPWESLSQFVRNLGEDRSPTYASVWERMATRVLPALQAEKVAGVQEIMDIIIKGGKSNLGLLLPELLQAAEAGDGETLREILADAKLPRSEWWSKWKGDKTRIPAAKATLTREVALDNTNLEWRLVITMSEAQKHVIMNRLGQRVEYE